MAFMSRPRYPADGGPVINVRSEPKRSMTRRQMMLSVTALTAISGWWALAPDAHAEPASEFPAWLRQHVGEGEGQIARVVLLRARALYSRKVEQGVVRNPCYFAMDATRPNSLRDGTPGRRFYVICEAQQTFMAISSGHGSGRDLGGYASFSNDRQCAGNFGNAADSYLTAGGAYVTADIKATFKGFYRASATQDEPLLRRFVQFDGEGETNNARERAIGGHASVALKNMCLKREPRSSYVDADGYAPFGVFTEYVGGRSDGCTSWSLADTPKIMSMIERNPTTVYIYPTSADIAALDRQLATGHKPEAEGVYWNAFCLHAIGKPKFWSKEALEPILARYKLDHPPAPPRPLPLCRE